VFALRSVTPNPAQDVLHVLFSLPQARPAKIQVFSVTGRLVESREVGQLGPGSHSVTLGRQSRLASGIYIVRLSQGGRALTARVVLVR
jgi:hypothetical protein